MGVRTIERPAILGWYPTGSEDPKSSGTVLYLNSKHLIPQYFEAGQGLSGLCICRGSLPEWVSPQKEHDVLFPEAPQSLTPNLVFVAVTPTVWAWSRVVQQRLETRTSSGKGSDLLKFQTEVLEYLLPYYCQKRYEAKELQSAITECDRRLGQGAALSDLLPEPDEVFEQWVRWKQCEPWDGCERWCERIRERRARPAVHDSQAAAADQGKSLTSISSKRATSRGPATPAMF